MAKISAAAFKTEVAVMATALTVMYKDSVETAVALEISNNQHPLRRLSPLFLFNPATGVVTANDAYIDDAYAGLVPSKGNELAVVTSFPATLVTATVEDAAPTLIVFTYNQNLVSDPQHLPLLTDFVLGGTQSYLFTKIETKGPVLTLTSATAFIAAETITVTYDPALATNPIRIIKDNIVVPAMAAEVVTNNVA